MEDRDQLARDLIGCFPVLDKSDRSDADARPGPAELADARHELDVLRGQATDLNQRLTLALTDLSRALAKRDEARDCGHDLEAFARQAAELARCRAELGEARKALDLVRDCHDDGRYGFCCDQAYPCETVQYLDDVSWARAGNRP